MAFLVDTQELKPGLIIFRRADVQHRNWYCRIRLPQAERYKTISLKTPNINEARDKAFDQDADVRFRIKHEIPVFDKTFAQAAEEFSNFQKERSEAGEISFHRWRVMKPVAIEQHGARFSQRYAQQACVTRAELPERALGI